VPEIDVTEVLTDSFIAGESFSVVRRPQITGTDGFVSTTDVVIPGVIGSVTPVGENSMVRDEAYSNQLKTIKVVTPFLLRGVAETIDGVEWSADLVLWKDTYYIVRTLEDYSQYGVGMVDADCVSFAYMPNAPVAKVVL
jgi:hypothetical protein